MWRVWLTAAALAVAPGVHAGALQDMPWGSIDARATGREVPGPAGWLNFCMATPDRCHPAAGPVVVTLSPQMLAQIKRVQAEVNARVVAQSEPVGQDLWQLATTSGDCEDYALAKQAALLAVGLPAGAVRLATALLPDGAYHAVVTVASTSGTLVLDNLQPSVVPFGSLRYAWLKLQGAHGSLRWDELRDGPAPASATAALPGDASIPSQQAR